MNVFKKYCTKDAIQEFIDSVDAKLYKQREQVDDVVAVLYHVGDDPASEVYLKQKISLASKFDINVQLLGFPTKTSIKPFTDLVRFNQSYSAKTFPQMVQFPVPWKSFDINTLGLKERDIDGLSAGSIVNPCTPQGIIDWLDWVYEQEGMVLEDRNIVIINRSDIVGNPLHRLALSKNMNVTQLHSKTSPESLVKHLSMADIIVTAVGKPNFINEDVAKHIPGNSIIVDVGISRIAPAIITGDCSPVLQRNFDVAVTPVPRGVGLMTTRYFIKNILTIAKYFKDQE